MPYVVPNSEAQFFVSTGLSPSHENSLYFASTGAKDSYFDGLNKFTVSEVTYQRENRGYIRVQLPVNNLIRCDYMRFKNTSFENTWFYAFITQVNYINNITTEVQYVLDPLMTWMGYFVLKPCYVERQHTVNDGIGNNICDEGLPTGTYVMEEINKTFSSDDLSVAVVYANAEAGGALVNNIYQGCTTAFFRSNEVDLLNQTLLDVVGINDADNIVGLYMLPTRYATNDALLSESYGFAKPYKDVDGYVPKNNKLFCYPYKYVEVDNMEGSTQIYEYEYFNSTPPATSSGIFQFKVLGANNGNLELVLYPLNYKDKEFVDDNTHIHNSLGMHSFPPCSWSIDSYKAWLAQKNAYYELDTAISVGDARISGGYSGLKTGMTAGAKIGSNLGGGGFVSALTGTAGAIAGGALGAGIGGYLGQQEATDLATYDNLTRNEITPHTPNQNKGTNTAAVLTSCGAKTFQVKEMTITHNYAQMIDDYFTMYGYAVKQVLTPNMNARPHWTYVKTIGCNVNGAFPASDARAIEAIFDNGVRLWHNLDEMGNYSLDNSPS